MLRDLSIPFLRKKNMQKSKLRSLNVVLPVKGFSITTLRGAVQNVGMTRVIILNLC